MTIQIALIIFPSVALVSVNSNLTLIQTTKYPNSDAVWSAIKANEIGAQFARLANNTSAPKIETIHCPEVPFQIYAVDFGNGVECSVMAENDHLVVLCSGFGGGRATGFTLLKEGNQSTLSFHFSTGSGIIRTIDCKYVLGSREVISKGRPWQP